MVALTHGSLSSSFSSGMDHGSLFSRVEWWLIRNLDAVAERREARASLALMEAMDDRMRADIGYGTKPDA